MKKLTAGIIASSGVQNFQLRETILMVINCLLVPVKGYKGNSLIAIKQCSHCLTLAIKLGT